MAIVIPHIWTWVICCLFVTSVTSAIMARQARHFFYLDRKDGTVKKFSIFNLEVPAGKQAMVDLIRQIGLLPGNRPAGVYTALHGQLYADFAFMPGAYIGIFLLCMKASYNYTGGVGYFFACLAWLQSVAWVCDITENFYILHKITMPFVASWWVFAAYRLVEVLKWGLSLTGLVSSVTVLIIHVFKR